jgi:MerR family transcriptional regulator, light-induced transcriptional regulator
MTSTNTSADAGQQARIRSGTAARLAGLPVTTLRVWERRYGVVPASKTATGHRIYSNYDVLRLRSLRELTNSGHAIGSIAALDLESLQTLLAGLAFSESVSTKFHQKVVVVGRVAAIKLATFAGCETVAVFEDLDQAQLQTTSLGTVDVLLVRLPSLQMTTASHVMALAAKLGAGHVIVLYSYSAKATASSLRAAGATLRREPISGIELARIMRDLSQPRVCIETNGSVAPRLFSDESLARLAELPSPIACECLRHMTEIVAQLTAFERYSRECASSSPADAALHRDLSAMAGAARTRFEQALQRAVAE